MYVVIFLKLRCMKNNNSRNIVVVEFWESHDECLFPICHLLKKNGYNITLAVNKKIRKRLSKPLLELVDGVAEFSFGHNFRGFIAQIEFYFYLLRNKFSAVHINTAQGSTTWKFFLLPIPHRIKVTGVLHHTVRLKEFGQKLLTRRIDNYVLLSDLMKSSYISYTDKPYVVIYPIFYPSIKTVDLIKPDDELWIVIPGGVEQSRHDYFSLLSFIGNSIYNSNIRFIILGNITTRDGKEFQRQIQERDLMRNFVFFEQYIPESLFYSYIAACDYIMPLINPDEKCYESYVKDKISGSFNLAFAYRKTMLCPESMRKFEDFADSSLFYDPANIVDFINSLILEKPKASFALQKWNENEQLKRLSVIYKNVN